MPEPFKNLLDAALVAQLGELVRDAYPEFPYDRYLADCLPQLEALELKQRAELIAAALRRALPPDTREAIPIVTKAISALPPLSSDAAQSGWVLFPINALLAQCGTEAFESSLELLRETTRRFTAEFGIRAFLVQRPDDTLAALERWSAEPDMHLRRLVSEGTRPRLPWGQRIPAFIRDPSPGLALLERLKDDPEEYVRRSVANHLNDISKDHPERMLDVVERWLKENPQRRRMLRHACRSLVKAGHTRCLRLLGHAAPAVEVESFQAASTVLTLGETQVMSARIRSRSARSQALVVDYRFHFVKANGKTAPKVFKGRTVELAPRASRDLSFRLHLKPITTRRYYAGPTQVDLFVNGSPLAQTTFTLLLP